jgi:hypothetical protein
MINMVGTWCVIELSFPGANVGRNEFSFLKKLWNDNTTSNTTNITTATDSTTTPTIYPTTTTTAISIIPTIDSGVILGFQVLSKYHLPWFFHLDASYLFMLLH